MENLNFYKEKISKETPDLISHYQQWKENNENKVNLTLAMVNKRFQKYRQVKLFMIKFSQV